MGGEPRPAGSWQPCSRRCRPLVRSIAVRDTEARRVTFRSLVLDARWAGLYAGVGAPLTIVEHGDHPAVTRPALLFGLLGA